MAMIRLVLDAAPANFFVGDAILDIGKPTKIESQPLFRGTILRDRKHFYAKNYVYIHLATRFYRFCEIEITIISILTELLIQLLILTVALFINPIKCQNTSLYLVW